MRLQVDVTDFTYAGSREPAVRDLHFELDPGEIVGIVGQAGAGKTTLCHLMSGFVPHFYRGNRRGTVRLGGWEAAGTAHAEWLARVGVVFQNPFTQLTGARFTVREEVAFALENAGVPREEMETRVDAVLARVGLESLAKRSPYELSGGQQQMVALASIMVIEPQVLVLDEPAAQLDPRTARLLYAILKAEAETGTLVIITDHDTTLLAAHATRIIALHDGRPMANAPPREVFAQAIPGVRPPSYMQIAALASEHDLWPPDRPLAVTLEEAAEALRPHHCSDPAPAADIGSGGAIAASDPAPAADIGSGGAIAASDRTSLDEFVAPHAVAEAVARGGAAAVEVVGLVHAYESGTEALRGVSLMVPVGQRVALVGANGAGKSTLARHLVGLLKPKQGTVKVMGVDVAGKAGFAARYAAYAFQNPDDQLFMRRVRDEVAFGPRNLGVRGVELDQRVTEALSALALEDTADANPRDLDLPLRKRLALACVLAMDAPVVILDEPTGNLDALEAARLVALLDGLQSQGRTVIVVTHDMDFCAEHFARVVVVADGLVSADGAPHATLRSEHLLPPAAIQVAQRLDLERPIATRLSLIQALRGPRGGTSTPKG